VKHNADQHIALKDILHRLDQPIMSMAADFSSVKDSLLGEYKSRRQPLFFVVLISAKKSKEAQCTNGFLRSNIVSITARSRRTFLKIRVCGYCKVANMCNGPNQVCRPHFGCMASVSESSAMKRHAFLIGD
jgi:hypothetical protein